MSSALSGPDPGSARGAFDDTVDKNLVDGLGAVVPTNAAALPPIEVDPLALKHSRQSLLAKMFGTKREPNRLDRYELLEELGRGGMGVVYKAHDPKLNRHVAIKLITKDDPRMRDRFRREAQAIAKVKHPNVIDIYDTDFDENERPYLTMEYVDGQTLKDWLHESSRDIYDIFKVFAAAGRGLEIVHNHGIVHHDFKPENVMIAKDGRVLVADFGLARATLTNADDETMPARADHADAFRVNITQTGALLGTLHYMAPELLDKTRGDIRTDQFAFCVSLYEALTGERFFQLRGKTQHEVYEEILHCQPKPLPRAKKVPRRVEAAIRKGLSLRPADRHASMKELTDLLERVSKRPERLRWFTWAAIVLVAILAFIGAFVVTRMIASNLESLGRATSMVEAVRMQAATQMAAPPPPVEPEPEPEPELEPEPLPEPKPHVPDIAEVDSSARPGTKPKRSKPKRVLVYLHAGDFDAAVFDFGPDGVRTVSKPGDIELPATKIDVKCREYDANKTPEWMTQTLDLRTGKRTIKCFEDGPSLH